MRIKTINIVAALILVCGLVLLSVNIYGLSKDVRQSPIDPQYLRFHDDVKFDFDEGMKMLQMREGDDAFSYAKRATLAISGTLAHIHWGRYEPTKFNQLVPIWENYFLHFLGVFSGMKEYQRYHFAHFERSLYRGIGICGDASMIMSQVLDINNIDNQIISVPGHVIVQAKMDDGNVINFDPDFGVVLPYSISQINDSPELVADHYYDAGYSEKEVNNLVTRYGKNVKTWDGVSHFIRKKYYFEHIAYALKWPFPILLVMLGAYFLIKARRKD